MILNLAFMMKQKERLGYVTGSMILINIFQGIYVWDGIYQEKAILSTMDITTGKSATGIGTTIVKFGRLLSNDFAFTELDLLKPGGK